MHLVYSFPLNKFFQADREIQFLTHFIHWLQGSLLYRQLLLSFIVQIPTNSMKNNATTFKWNLAKSLIVVQHSAFVFHWMVLNQICNTERHKVKEKIKKSNHLRLFSSELLALYSRNWDSSEWFMALWSPC